MLLCEQLNQKAPGYRYLWNREGGSAMDGQRKARHRVYLAINAPKMPLGGSRSRDGKAVAMLGAGRIIAVGDRALAGAPVDVCHAECQGRCDTQKAPVQPEQNLHGRLCADTRGRIRFSTAMLRGSALPSDGSVGRLLAVLEFCPDRPEHLKFRVEAKGCQRVTPHICHQKDPAMRPKTMVAARSRFIRGFLTKALPEKHKARSFDVTIGICPPANAQHRIREENT